VLLSVNEAFYKPIVKASEGKKRRFGWLNVTKLERTDLFRNRKARIHVIESRCDEFL
jgi:hypothetical protein